MLFCDIFCDIFVIYFVICEQFWYVRKIFGPLKWYTDRNFFGDGGGGGGGGRSSKNIFRIANTFVASYAMKYSEIFFVIRKFFAYTPPTYTC